VTGNVKDVASTVIGAIVFHDFTPTFSRVTGLAISLLGGVGFGAAKFFETHVAKRAANKPRD
jgi:hypothetical protein